MSEHAHLTVDGMVCGGCENAVKQALLQTPGVTEAAASHRDRRVDVAFDSSQISVDDLREKITSLGYVVAPEG